MRKIEVPEYIQITDLYAVGIQAIFAALGDEDTPGSAIAQAAAVRDLVTALALPDEAQLTADLISPTINVVTEIGRESALAGRFAQFNNAVLIHLGQDLNAWLAAEGTRVHHLWKRGGNPNISAANTFPPVTPLGTYVVTGSGEGIFTDGGDVNTLLFGGAQIELEVTNQIGESNVNVSVTATTAAGGTVTRTGQIPSGSGAGATVQLGSTADRIVGITSVTITGGTADDAFKIQTVEDRTLT